MQKISKWKLVTAIVFTIFATIYILPNFTDKAPKWLPGNKVNLGLDLRGGSQLLLSVNFESYIKDMINSVSDSLKKELRKNKIGYKNIITSKETIKFDLRSLKNDKKLKEIIKNIDPNISFSMHDNRITLYYNEYVLNQLEDRVVNQSIEIIRMRVDSDGTKEPNIQRQGSRDILLQVPGQQNPSELKRIIGKTAKLTFHLVDENISNKLSSLSQIPLDSRIVEYQDSTQNSKIAIKKNVIVSGDQLQHAQIDFQDMTPVVGFSFNTVGAKKFGEATSGNRGKRLAVLLDEKVISAPVINDPILSGRGVITGNFTVDSATELSLMLQAGALPAPLKVVEERTIGPNLGADSIESGKIAAFVGFILVVLFMSLSYGILGIFANITLVIALVYILALLSMLNATLTLPGIAGIILTIGMAVDANVLIYEKIREELVNGSSNLYAIKSGFQSAFGTITDSNVTTLIAAFLLYNFGVGAIKGFAVTLTIGIIASMYGALVVTKLMIDLWIKYINPKSLGL